MLDVDQLEQVHPGYAEYAYRWDYYIRSYMGAEEYRDGAYLRKYIAEDQAPGNQYTQRLMDTPLQNHVKTTVDTYRSFLFRNEPTRTLGPLVDNEFANRFVNDVDLDGTNITQFMREVADMVFIYGGCWIGTDRPAYAVETAAEEEALDIRAYAQMWTPANVLNWEYTRQPNGKKTLSMIRIIDEKHQDRDVIRCIYPDRIDVYTVTKDGVSYNDNSISNVRNRGVNDKLSFGYDKIVGYETYVNPLGYIPIHFVSVDKSFHRGVGTSIIGDVADLQRSIYNKLTELYQNIRISSHPSIVAEPSTELNGGVGAVVTVDENTNIQPYLLQPTGASIDGIISAIELDMEAIEDITHLKAVKAKSGSPMSGVALQTERQNLNNRLASMASQLQIAETKLWADWMAWQGIAMPEEFEVYYEKSFDMRDKHSDLELYRKAIETVPHDSFVHYMHDEIARMLIDDDEDLQEIIESIADDHEEMMVDVPTDMDNNQTQE